MLNALLFQILFQHIMLSKYYKMMNFLENNTENHDSIIVALPKDNALQAHL